MAEEPRVVTNLRLAGLVARHVQIESINLVNATLTSNVDPRAPNENLDLTQAHRAAYTLGDGEIGVSIEFRFSGHERESGREVIQLVCDYRLVYSLDTDEELPELALEHFANLNGPYNAWPYWREMIQTVAGRVGLGAIVLPVYRPKREEIEVPPAEEQEEGSSLEPETVKEDES